MFVTDTWKALSADENHRYWHSSGVLLQGTLNKATTKHNSNQKYSHFVFNCEYSWGMFVVLFLLIPRHSKLVTWIPSYWRWITPNVKFFYRKEKTLTFLGLEVNNYWIHAWSIILAKRSLILNKLPYNNWNDFVSSQRYLWSYLNAWWTIRASGDVLVVKQSWFLFNFFTFDVIF